MVRDAENKKIDFIFVIQYYIFYVGHTLYLCISVPKCKSHIYKIGYVSVNVVIVHYYLATLIPATVILLIFVSMLLY